MLEGLLGENINKKGTMRRDVNAQVFSCLHANVASAGNTGSAAFSRYPGPSATYDKTLALSHQIIAKTDRNNFVKRNKINTGMHSVLESNTKKQRYSVQFKKAMQ